MRTFLQTVSLITLAGDFLYILTLEFKFDNWPKVLALTLLLLVLLAAGGFDYYDN